MFYNVVLLAQKVVELFVKMFNANRPRYKRLVLFEKCFSKVTFLNPPPFLEYLWCKLWKNIFRWCQLWRQLLWRSLQSVAGGAPLQRFFKCCSHQPPSRCTTTSTITYFLAHCSKTRCRFCQILTGWPRSNNGRVHFWPAQRHLVGSVGRDGNR